MLKKAGLSLGEIKMKQGKGQRSEAGSQRPGDGRTDGIDLLLREWRRLLRWKSLGFFRGERDKPLHSK